MTQCTIQLPLFFQTTSGSILLFDIEDEDDAAGLFKQNDSPLSSLRRDSAELFIKETIPSLRLKLVRIINDEI